MSTARRGPAAAVARPWLLLALLLAVCPACGPDKAQKSQRLYQQAQALLADEQEGPAIIELRNALTVDPDFLPAHRLLGDIALRQGHWLDAAAAYARVLDSRPDDPAALLGMARSLLETGQPDKAQAAVDRVLKADPTSYDAQVLQADLLFRRQHRDEALEQLRRLAADRPDKGDAPLLLAGLLTADGHPDEAAALLSRSLETVAVRPPVALRLGELLLSQGRYPQARQVYALLAREQPRRASPLRLLANALRLEGDIAAAAQAWKQAIALEPGNQQHRLDLAALYMQERHDMASAEVVLGQGITDIPRPYAIIAELAGIYAASGRAPQALQLLGKAIAESPDKAEEIAQMGLRRLRARILLAEGQAAAARKELDAILAKHPSDLESLSMRGTMAFERNDAPQAVVDFRRMAVEHPDKPHFRFMLAKAHFANSEPNSGARALEDVLRLEPANIQARRLLVAHHRLAGNMSKARREQEALVELHPEHPEFRRALADMHLLDGDAAAALKTLAPLLQPPPGSPETLQRLAAVRLAMNDHDAARQACEAALRSVPDFAPAVATLARLLLLRGQGEQALAVAGRAAADHPASFALALVLGDTALALGRMQQAHQAYADAALRQPAASGPYQRLMIGQAPQAEYQRLAIVLARKPDVIASAYALGLLQQQAGAADAAIEQYRTILARQPDFHPAAVSLAQALSSRAAGPEQAAQALAPADSAAAAGEPEALETLAQVHLRLGNSHLALDSLAQAMETAPDSPTGHLLAARIFLAANQKAMARKHLEAAMGLGLPPAALIHALQLRESLPEQ